MIFGQFSVSIDWSQLLTMLSDPSTWLAIAGLLGLLSRFFPALKPISDLINEIVQKIFPPSPVTTKEAIEQLASAAKREEFTPDELKSAVAAHQTFASEVGE